MMNYPNDDSIIKNSNNIEIDIINSVDVMDNQIDEELNDDFDNDYSQDLQHNGDENVDQSIEILVDEPSKGVRIDKLLSNAMTELSRSYIQKLIKDDAIYVNGQPVKSNYKAILSDRITVNIPKPTELNIEAEDIKLDILYEDSDVILINKPKGMVVHPSAGHYSGTLVNALLYHCKDELSGINGVLRPGIVHRIDMNTTGVMIACKNDYAHSFIADQLKVHSITRRYNALVYGKFKEESGKVDAPIGRHPNERKKMAINRSNGKRAVTHYNVIENLGNNYAHVECSLETGRTHQIRVHLSSVHHPLIGDDVYGPSKDNFHLQGQALHARVFGFIHPSTKEYMEFEAPLPEYFTNLIEKLKNK
jgi:23S rRNA pseudouridine1911/1915/1917 synthase